MLSGTPTLSLNISFFKTFKISLFMPNKFSDIVAKENLSNAEKLVTLDRTGQ